ncbi:unnamed protein product, partial [Pylaiella littoralis]
EKATGRPIRGSGDCKGTATSSSGGPGSVRTPHPCDDGGHRLPPAKARRARGRRTPRSGARRQGRRGAKRRDCASSGGAEIQRAL